MGVVGVILGLAIPLVLGVVAGIIVAIAGGDAGDLPSGVLIALTFLQDVGFVVAALFVARMARPPTARDFGLVPTPLWRRRRDRRGRLRRLLRRSPGSGRRS